MSANPHLKGILIAGSLATVAIALGLFTLSRQQPVSSAAGPIITHHPVIKTPAAKPKPAAAKPVVKPLAKPKPKPNPFVQAALAAKLPRPLALAFADHEVVVVTLYAPDGDVDRIVEAEASAGAGLGGAAFVGVDASREGTSGELTRAFGVMSAPTTLVLTRTDFSRAITTLDGFADRDTVAQAALNADPTPGAPTAQTPWARRAAAVCDRAKQQLAGLGELKSAAQLSQAAPKVRSITGSMLAGLGKLPAPAGREAEVQKFLSLSRQDVDLALELVAATVARNAAGVATASAQEATVGAQVNALAITLGAASCAETL